MGFSERYLESFLSFHIPYVQSGHNIQPFISWFPPVIKGGITKWYLPSVLILGFQLIFESHTHPTCIFLGLRPSSLPSWLWNLGQLSAYTKINAYFRPYVGQQGHIADHNLVLCISGPQIGKAKSATCVCAGLGEWKCASRGTVLLQEMGSTPCVLFPHARVLFAQHSRPAASCAPNKCDLR